jgi:hypothetical protein
VHGTCRHCRWTPSRKLSRIKSSKYFKDVETLHVNKTLHD